MTRDIGHWLADMSSICQHAILGNVLLDERFGTLDEEALDSALELLTQLKNTDGKLVGIISHVAKLGEKIPTQIKVSTSGGMGSLEGAGVHRVAYREQTATEPSTKLQKRKMAKKREV